ncbi:MAG: hypothetical protein ACRELB_15805 [Polyangiaceae bacterium]
MPGAVPYAMVDSDARSARSAWSATRNSSSAAAQVPATYARSRRGVGHFYL